MSAAEPRPAPGTPPAGALRAPRKGRAFGIGALAAILQCCLSLAAPGLAGTGPPASGYPVALHADGAPPSVVWIRQLPVRAARVRAVPRIEACDGLDATAIPLRSPLEVELTRSFTVAYMEADGTQAVCPRNGGQTLTSADAVPRSRFLFPESARARRLTLAPEGADGVLREVRLYQCSDAPLPPVPLEPATPDGSAGEALRFQVAAAVDRGITAIPVQVAMRAPLPSGLRLRLVHSAEPDRTWFQADVSLKPLPDSAAGRLVAVLDPPDIWCAEGDGITILLTPLAADGAPDATLRQSVGEVRAGVLTGSAEEVRDEFALPRLNWLAAWYAAHARMAPWDQPDWSPDAEPAVRWLRILRQWLPNHPGVTAYARRMLHLPPPAFTPAKGPANAPEWACLARELLKQTQDLAFWWRAGQHPDGLFSGDTSADTPLIETLATVPLITGEPALTRSVVAACEAAARAVEAPGASAALVETAPLTADRLHGAVEVLACTQPVLAMLEPANPVPIRRCLSVARALAAAMSTNTRGHRHLLLLPPPGLGNPSPVPVDVPGAAIAAGAALALCWHSGHPAAQRLVAEWSAAWAADVLDSVDPKDPGRLPCALDAHTCKPVSAPAWLPDPDGGRQVLLRFLLDAHRLSGNPQLLRPVRLAVASGTADALTTCLWRLVGDGEFDDRLVEAPSDPGGLGAYTAWLITGNKEFLTEGLRQAVAQIEADRYLLTEAHLPPDALQMPGMLLLRAIYLGGPGPWRGGLPRAAVTWENTGTAFAALVTRSQPDRLRIAAYHFGPHPQRVRLRVWSLRPGTYHLAAGPDDNQDGTPDLEAMGRVVRLERGDALSITLPAQRPYAITFTAQHLLPQRPRPDLALCPDEVALSPDGRQVTAAVRNLGSADASGIRVRVLDERGVVLGSAALAALPWPEDLRPAVQTVAVPLARPAAGRLKVSVTAATPEITLRNNAVWVRPVAISAGR